MARKFQVGDLVTYIGENQHHGPKTNQVYRVFWAGIASGEYAVSFDEFQWIYLEKNFKLHSLFST